MASIRTTQIGDTIEIKKIAQCSYSILTNHTDHPDCPYGKTNKPDEILPVGTQLTVIGKGKPETRYAQSYVTVNYKGKDFDILASDLRRFCK